MNPDDLAKILDELGRRLGPAGEHVFELAVRQVYITSLVYLIASIVFIVGTTVAIWAGYKLTKRAWDRAWVKYNASTKVYKSEPDIEGYFVIWLGPAIVAVIIYICAISTLFTSITPLLNPEYAAIKDILTTIGAAR